VRANEAPKTRAISARAQGVNNSQDGGGGCIANCLNTFDAFCAPAHSFVLCDSPALFLFKRGPRGDFAFEGTGCNNARSSAPASGPLCAFTSAAAPWHRRSRRAQCVCEVDGDGPRSEQRRGVLGRFGGEERPGLQATPASPAPRHPEGDAATRHRQAHENVRAAKQSGTPRPHCVAAKLVERLLGTPKPQCCRAFSTCSNLWGTSPPPSKTSRKMRRQARRPFSLAAPTQVKRYSEAIQFLNGCKTGVDVRFVPGEHNPADAL
jgi:hypothetical protein